MISASNCLLFDIKSARSKFDFIFGYVRIFGSNTFEQKVSAHVQSVITITRELPVAKMKPALLDLDIYVNLKTYAMQSLALLSSCNRRKSRCIISLIPKAVLTQDAENAQAKVGRCYIVSG
jgi:hypothetical protein